MAAPEEPEAPEASKPEEPAAASDQSQESKPESKAESKQESKKKRKKKIEIDPKEYEVDCKVSKQLPFKGLASRPIVTVYNISGHPTKKAIPMPEVMLAPIRADLVQFVHTNMAKNNRQPYAVQNREGPHGIRAGHQVAAKSWGTGRAVSRVPRVKGGGTHRAGQGAYGMTSSFIYTIINGVSK